MNPLSEMDNEYFILCYQDVIYANRWKCIEGFNSVKEVDIYTDKLPNRTNTYFFKSYSWYPQFIKSLQARKRMNIHFEFEDK